MKKILIFIALFLLMLHSFSENFYIDKYDVQIFVSKDNILKIVEIIDVHFNNPSHGIFRKIPLGNYVKRNDGSSYYNSAQVLNFHSSNLVSTERNSNSIIYKLGNPDKKITGSKKYVLSYDYVLSPNSIKENEFYFNIIGTDWDVDINKVNFIVYMPKEFNKEKVGFSIGRAGVKGYDSRLEFNVIDKQIYGTVNSKMFPNEALTIRLELPEGYFEKRVDSQSLFYIYFSLIICLIAYAIWFLFGRDRTIISAVNFKPPKGYNSAQIGMLYNESFDCDSLASLFLYFATKGYLKINSTASDIFLIKTADCCEKDDMAVKFFDSIFANSDEVSLKSLRLSNQYVSIIEEYMGQMNKFKNQIYIKSSISFFNYLIPVCCCFVLLLIFFYCSNCYSYDSLFGDSAFILIFPLVALCQLIKTLCDYSNKPFSIISNLLFLAIFGGVPLFVAITVFGMFQTITSNASIVSFVCLIIAIICAYNMPKKSDNGRRILGNILGFKKFLETAEKHRIEKLMERDSSYIHNMLPFALALGIDGKWVELVSQISSYSTPLWYEGELTPDSWHNLRTNFGNSVKSTVVKINSKNSSNDHTNSGFSGGGFAGGGSGGGGGGSW